MPLGPRKTILKAIEALRSTDKVALQVSPHSYTPTHLAQKILTARSALEGERKQVTVLFCDIVNSTALAQRLGQEPMHALLNRFFELSLVEVHRYEGTVNQFLGDGFMALFGAPVAHEDHARRAVLAALDIRRALADAAPALRGIEVRMGLNTGPVVVGKIGDNLRMDYTAVGDTTNLAARLQQHAEPGAIIISEATRRLVRGYIQAEPLPPMHVKGKGEPVSGFIVLGRGLRRSPLEGRDDRALIGFVGRERESSALADILADVEAGHGQVVGIVGEAGVGKSRLLYEFRQSLGKRRLTYLEGRCLSYGGAIPYLPVLDVLRADCELTDLDTHEAIADKVSSVLNEVGMEAEALPYLLLLLGIKEGTEALRDLSPETIRSRTFQALARLLLGGSRRQPLILAIEDLHWIDKTSEEFLSSLVESQAGAPVLLLGTYRPGYRPPWMDQSYATQIALRPLSAEDSRSVVASTLTSGPILEELAQSIIHKGEGNPFFLEELARSVVERGVERARHDLPDTIQGVLLARIDRLQETAKRLLQTAAVLGREAPLRLLREICDAPERLDADLQELKRQEFVYENSTAREPTVVFKHVLTQEAAYESLLTARREALHETAGKALEQLYADRLEEQYDLLAYHYPRSPNFDKALEYLVRANRKAMNANALTEAKGYFQQAMSLLDRLPGSEINQRQRLSLLTDQIVMFQNLFQMQEYYELLTRYEPVARALGDPALLGPLTLQIGHCDWTFGRFEQARERFHLAIELCEATGNYASAAHAYQISMWNLMCMGEFEKVIALTDRAERAWVEAPNLRWYVYALSAASFAYAYLGRFDQATALGHQALAVTEQFRDDTNMSFAAWSLGFAYMCKGDLSRAIEYDTLGVEKAPTPAERAWAEGSLGAALCRAGEVDKAIAILAPLSAGLRSGGFVPGERFALFLGEAYLRDGQFACAKQAMEEGLQIQTDHGMSYEAGVTHRLLAELALSVNPAQSEEPLAEHHFLQSIAMLDAVSAPSDLALAHWGFGRLRTNQGRIMEAREHLSRALGIFETLGTLMEPERIRIDLNALPSA